MSPLPGSRRLTPLSSSAVESGTHRVVRDGRYQRGTLRALALLVDRIATIGMINMGRQEAPAALLGRPAVRDALRALIARCREDSIQCYIVDGQYILGGEAVDRGLTRDDPLLEDFLERCQVLSVGSILVRQGASPGELFTLASVLSSRDAESVQTNRSDTPTTIGSISEDSTPPVELLRSWSVLVTRADPSLKTPPEFRTLTPEEGMIAIAAQLPEGTISSAAAVALERLSAATSDDAASAAVGQLVGMLDDADIRGDASVVEGIAHVCMVRIHSVGTGATRLALERLLRRLQHKRTLELLSERLPHAPVQRVLLEVFARAGEVSIEILANQLLRSHDAAARRAYFDSIVSLDLGASLLFDLVRDKRWYVVRNAVALLGEIGVPYADAVMLPLTASEDDRIRIAVARSLMRLGTARALAGLHGLIDDPNNEVRRIAAASYGFTASTSGSVRPPAARLAQALERETDEDVALEMLASLGRLGSADAVQRLLRIALPPPQPQDGSERPPPRPAYMRVAAIEALMRARGQAVIAALESLKSDPDPEVAAAARRLDA